MAVDYVWSVKDVCFIDTDQCSDVIQSVDWEVKATEGPHEVSMTGTTSLALPEDDCVAYEDLTEEMVLSWVKANISESYKNEVEGYLLFTLKSLSKEKKPLPWLNPKKTTKKTKPAS
jgi:hypothetical protein